MAMALALLQKPTDSSLAALRWCCWARKDESSDEADIGRQLEKDSRDGDGDGRSRKPRTDADSGYIQAAASASEPSEHFTIKSPSSRSSLVPADVDTFSQKTSPPEKSAAFNASGTSGAASFGNLELTLEYDAKGAVLTIEIKKLLNIRQELFDPEHYSHYSLQVRLAVLPAKEVRAKSTPRSIMRPEFNETFSFKKIQESALTDATVRVRAYRSLRHRRDQLIAESLIAFPSALVASTSTSTSRGRQPQKVDMNVKLEATIKAPNVDVLRVKKEDREGDSSSNSNSNSKKLRHVPLQAIALDAVSLADGSSTSDVSSVISSSTLSLRAANNVLTPELMLGMAYMPLTGRITVSVQKGVKMNPHNLKILPDSYVKIILLNSDGNKVNETRTKVRADSAEPVFDETFIFNVPSFKLNEMTVMISAYNNRAKTKKRAIIGWISLGAQNSGPEQAQHWNDMKTAGGRPISRWHALLVM